MIGLSDQGLALLCIAASAIPRSRRGYWLRGIAKELEGNPPSNSARRLRQYRARQRGGLRHYHVVCDEVDLEELLISAGTLAASERDDHGAVERGLQRLLEVLIADHQAGNAFPPGQGIYDTVRVKLCLSALRRKVSGGPPK
jgi:hypothetical protein